MSETFLIPCLRPNEIVEKIECIDCTADCAEWSDDCAEWSADCAECAADCFAGCN